MNITKMTGAWEEVHLTGGHAGGNCSIILETVVIKGSKVK